MYELGLVYRNIQRADRASADALAAQDQAVQAAIGALRITRAPAPAAFALDLPEPETPRAPQPPPAPPVVVTQPAFNAAYLNNPKPDYPQMAFRRGETGTVYVLVLVTKEGRAGRVSVHKSSGSPALDTAATRAITGWRFEPGRKGSEPVESEVIVPMPFTLKEAP